MKIFKKLLKKDNNQSKEMLDIEKSKQIIKQSKEKIRQEKKKIKDKKRKKFLNYKLNNNKKNI